MPSHDSDTPSAWIVRFAHLIAPGACVLDLACGRGRHARFFAARGAHVEAVDRDPELLAALRDMPGVRTRVADLESGPWPYAMEKFDAVIVTNYLHRPLFPLLLNAVADGGVLVYETFGAGNEHFGKPSNPAFLLQPGELLHRCAPPLHVLAYEDGVSAAPARVQRLCALRMTLADPEKLLLAPNAAAS